MDCAGRCVAMKSRSCAVGSARPADLDQAAPLRGQSFGALPHATFLPPASPSHLSLSLKLTAHSNSLKYVSDIHPLRPSGCMHGQIQPTGCFGLGHDAHRGSGRASARAQLAGGTQPAEP